MKFSRSSGKLSQGAVKFVGHLPGHCDAYLGVELDKEGGCSCSKGNKRQHLYPPPPPAVNNELDFPKEFYLCCLIVYFYGNFLFFSSAVGKHDGKFKGIRYFRW